MAERILRIAGISDTHINATHKTPAIPKEAYIEHVQDMSRHADLIIHGGDFTDKGDLASAKIAAEIFRASSVPVIGVLGNHDYEKDVTELTSILKYEGGIQLLSGNIYPLDKEDRTVNIIGASGFTLRGQERLARDIGITVEELEALSEEQLANFSKNLKVLKGNDNIGLLHFQPARQFRDERSGRAKGKIKSSEFGRVIDENKNALQVVFHGHDHYGVNVPDKTRLGVDIVNLAESITITMTPGVPYRLIQLPLS